ncbi:MAG: hypothetical protein K1X74_04590 [Pirellulales bacterium]|nr:hypothetical protein [Pirellulales bacterium]
MRCTKILVLSALLSCAMCPCAARRVRAGETSALALPKLTFHAPQIDHLPPVDPLAVEKLPDFEVTTRDSDWDDVVADEFTPAEEPLVPLPAIDEDGSIEEPARDAADETAPETPGAEQQRVVDPPSLADEVETPKPTEPLAPLRDRLRRVLKHYYGRPLDSRLHNPWEVMHGIIAFGCDSQLIAHGTDGRVNAIAYACWNGDCAGDRLLYINNGRVDARQGPRVQGHFGQFLAILAQSRVPLSYPLQVNQQTFQLSDLLETEKLGCRTHTELTFKLIAISHYCDTDTTWKSDIGEDWSVPKLLREEIAAPIRGAPCGGTHRLTGITYAYQKRQREGRPIDGQYERARQYISDYIRYARSLQNPDGSFSTEWFARRGDRPDVERKLQTTGHIFEWYVLAIDEAQIREPRTLQTVEFLVRTLEEQPTKSWAIGPLGHALHALTMFDRRAFGSWSPIEGQPASELVRTGGRPETSGSGGD